MGAEASLGIAALRRAYESGRTPADVFAEVKRRIGACERRGVWIHLLEDAAIERQLAGLAAARRDGKALPLYGIPFAVKDNIDVAGVPTTAGCPDFAYVPERSATVVERLCDAGAVVVGKTNLDQFAAGLVGTRSPYGACENAFDPEWISGGSSSGSAVAVACGLVSFSLGTDTAGSGRVPASFNGLVGLKPTRGLLSNAGVVPACRSLDCVSIFSRDVADARELLGIAAGEDAADPFSRASPAADAGLPDRFRCGVPGRGQLEFFGDSDAAALFEQAVERVRGAGAQIVPIDFGPFREAAELLYDGPWVVERLEAPGRLLREKPEAIRPELRSILNEAERYTASQVFAGHYRLQRLRKAAGRAWEKMDLLLLPTTPTIYRIHEIAADPMRLNRRLGTYTNFVNLLDLSAIAVPNGFLPSSLPMGVTFMARAFEERRLLELATVWEAQTGVRT